MKRFLVFLTVLVIVGLNNSAYSSTFTFDGQQQTFYEDDPVPAIVIEEEIETEEDSAWTYRFLIPTSVAIAVLVIIGNVIQYFRQVTRKRYKVIEK
ncbi:MAG: hypothetical protein CL508_03300 [Actinobacteria bacterium]|nr:hypothetical protein [Actinomycetota bacterium]